MKQEGDRRLVSAPPMRRRTHQQALSWVGTPRPVRRGQRVGDSMGVRPDKEDRAAPLKGRDELDKSWLPGSGTDTALSQRQGTGVGLVHALPYWNGHVDILRRRASRDKKRKMSRLPTWPCGFLFVCPNPLWA